MCVIQNSSGYTEVNIVQYCGFHSTSNVRRRVRECARRRSSSRPQYSMTHAQKCSRFERSSAVTR